MVKLALPFRRTNFDTIALGVAHDAFPLRSTNASGAYTVPVMLDALLPVRLTVFPKPQACQIVSPENGPLVIAVS